MPSWRTFPLALGVAALAATAACVDEATDPPPGVVDPAFYETPAPLPEGKPGDILRVEAVEGLGGDRELLRVLYRSESLAGAPIAVSGVIAVPPGAPPAGGWPVLSLAHGSVGLADRCAPSRDPGPQAAEVAAQGFVVVATDYEGLGTDGLHPYLVGESEARGVIDVVRAARALGDRVGASARYAVIGYSQGGQAALFANEISASWAPELTLVGTVAGAPAVELDTWIPSLTDPALDWLKVSLAAGLAAVDPQADLRQVLAPEALERLSLVEERCAGDVASAFSGGGALAADLAQTPPFDRLLRESTPGQRAGAGPVLVIGGDADTLVPPALLDRAQARMCGVGQVVDRRQYPGADHAGIIGASLGDAIGWVRLLFAGQAAGDACP